MARTHTSVCKHIVHARTHGYERSPPPSSSSTNVCSWPAVTPGRLVATSAITWHVHAQGGRHMGLVSGSGAQGLPVHKGHVEGYHHVLCSRAMPLCVLPPHAAVRAASTPRVQPVVTHWSAACAPPRHPSQNLHLLCVQPKPATCGGTQPSLNLPAASCPAPYHPPKYRPCKQTQQSNRSSLMFDLFF